MMKNNKFSFIAITKPKILLSFIIFFILVFFFISNLYVHGFSQSPLFLFSYWPLLLFYKLVIYLFSPPIGYIEKILITITILVVEILYIYIISCALVWLFTKIREKDEQVHNCA